MKSPVLLFVLFCLAIASAASADSTANVINTAAIENPAIVTETAKRFGRCCTVVNIDPKRVQKDGREVWDVHIHGGRHQDQPQYRDPRS